MSIKNIKAMDLLFYQDFKKGPSGVYENGGIITGDVPIKKGWAEFSNDASNYIEYPHIAMKGRTELTVGCKIKNYVNNGATQTIICQASSVSWNDNIEWYIYITSADYLSFYIKPQGGTAVSSSFLISEGKEYSLVGVWESGEVIRVYLNGVENTGATSTGTITDTVQPLRIGQRSNGNVPFDGFCKDLFVSNRAWTAQEVKDWHNGSTFRFMQESKIFLPMDNDTVDKDGTTRITKDKSGNGLHATLGAGDGGATTPSFDSSLNRFTFDGGDYMKFDNNKDVKTILSKMGTAQDETYVFYMDKAIWTQGTLQNLFRCTDGGSQYIAIYYHTSDRFRMYINDGGTSESVYVDERDTVSTNNKAIMLVFQRWASSKQKVWINDRLVASEADAVADVSLSGDDKYVGAGAGAYAPLLNNTGLGLFGYWNKALTPTQIKYLYHYLRSLKK